MINPSRNKGSNLKKDLVEEVLDFILKDIQHDGIRKKAEKLKKEYKSKYAYIGKDISRIGQKQYDELIEEIFTATLDAQPREVLLDRVLKKLDALSTRNHATTFFVLEATTHTDHSLVISTGIQRGLNEKQWQNFGKIIEKKGWADQSFLLQQLFKQGKDIDIWHMPNIVDYHGELDTLFTQNRHKNERQRRNFWLSAVALPSKLPSHPNRALFAIYPDIGTEFSPSPPPDAVQERRVLHFFSIAYRQLDHQLENISALVREQREQILNTLAPGILHHEIGMNLELIHFHLMRTLESVAQLDDKFEHPLITRTKTGLTSLAKVAGQLYTTSDAFNNLEQRRGAEPFPVIRTLQWIERMTKYRLANVGVRLTWNEQQVDTELTSDSALLFHALINVVMNAANAFEEQNETTTSQKKRNIHINIEHDGKDVYILIMNNGSPIDKKVEARIFERGFTTRFNGHGQGLYLSRLILGYLGGRLDLIPMKKLPESFTVGFQFILPIQPLHTFADL